MTRLLFGVGLLGGLLLVTSAPEPSEAQPTESCRASAVKFGNPANALDDVELAQLRRCVDDELKRRSGLPSGTGTSPTRMPPPAPAPPPRPLPAPTIK